MQECGPGVPHSQGARLGEPRKDPEVPEKRSLGKPRLIIKYRSLRVEPLAQPPPQRHKQGRRLHSCQRTMKAGAGENAVPPEPPGRGTRPRRLRSARRRRAAHPGRPSAGASPARRAHLAARRPFPPCPQCPFFQLNNKDSIVNLYHIFLYPLI